MRQFSSNLSKAHLLGPLVLLIIGLLVFISLYEQIKQAQKESLKKLVQGMSESVTSLVGERLGDRFIALDRMASRHRSDSEEMRSEWQKDAFHYYHDFSGFQALEWADETSKVKWIYPLKGNEAVLGLALNMEGKRGDAIKSAHESGKGTITKLVQLKQGGVGFLSIHPTFDGAVLSGYVVGVFKAEDIFSKSIKYQYNLEIRFDDEIAFANRSMSPSEYQVETKLDLRNISLTFKVDPTMELIEQELNKKKAMLVPSFVLLIFILMATFYHFLIKSRSLLREALKHAEEAKEAIDEVLIYAKTDKRGLILEVNKKFESVSGYSRSELIGQDHRILNSGKHSKKFFRDLWSTIAKGNIWRGEIQNRSKTGRLYWVDTSIIPLKDENGNITGYSALRTEITDKKIFEEQLQRSQEKAIRALNTKSRFLANMSHEIRTPMNGIIGLTEVLKGRIDNLDCRDKIECIQKSGHSLLKIIDDILDFSKLEAGKVELDIVSIDLRKELSQIVELLADKASENGTMISLNLNHDLPKWIYADPVRVRQVVTNLLSNAIKFTSHGLIDVRAANYTEGEESFVKISVKDSGIGIPLEHQEKLFQSFSQVDASTTRKYGGTGLGLSICKGLVTSMGGRMWLNSTPDIGSIFYFTFPLKESKEAPDWDVEPDQDNMVLDASISILVAEDNSINRSVIDGYLESLGCHADFACNGKEAIAMCQSKDYDLILMDCNMPVIDGYKATQAIKAFSQSTKIIALTASAMASDKEKCMQAGMDGFLSKPLSKLQLKKELYALKNPSSITTAEVSTPVVGSSGRLKTINEEDLMEAFDGDDEFMFETIQLVRDQLSKMSDDLKIAYDSKESQKLKHVAHASRGVLSNIFAEKSIELLKDLEANLEHLNDSELSQSIDDISQELRMLDQEVEKFISKSAA